MEVVIDQAAEPGFLGQAAEIARVLVADGAALGWVEPPSVAEVDTLLREVARDPGACLAAAWEAGRLLGFGYWRRYGRPTLRANADVHRLLVARQAQGRGVGRGLMTELIGAARAAGVEVLTLDYRGNNEIAAGLYRSLGFAEHGRLSRFVAVGALRYDLVLYSLDLRRFVGARD